MNWRCGELYRIGKREAGRELWVGFQGQLALGWRWEVHRWEWHVEALLGPFTVLFWRRRPR